MLLFFVFFRKQFLLVMVVSLGRWSAEFFTPPFGKLFQRWNVDLWFSQPWRFLPTNFFDFLLYVSVTGSQQHLEWSCAQRSLRQGQRSFLHVWKWHQVRTTLQGSQTQHLQHYRVVIGFFFFLCPGISLPLNYDLLKTRIHDQIHFSILALGLVLTIYMKNQQQMGDYCQDS